MRVNVIGKSPEVSTEEFRRASNFYAQHLMGSQSESLRLSIELRPYMRGDCGAMSCLDWRRSKHFYVQIMTGSGKRMKQLCVLAHEMVHIKQVVMGQLRLSRDRILVWRSSPVPGTFQDEPWEKEAYETERALYHLYNRSRLP